MTIDDDIMIMMITTNYVFQMHHVLIKKKISQLQIIAGRHFGSGVFLMYLIVPQMWQAYGGWLDRYW